jgi:hypothetical protein
MSRAVLTLDSTARREQAIDWVRKAKTGSRVEFKGRLAAWIKIRGSGRC